MILSGDCEWVEYTSEPRIKVRKLWFLIMKGIKESEKLPKYLPHLDSQE